ncbi:hypothetical protein ACFW3Z_06165 [Nocardiopsis alba]|uniref:hypothetical protein n=1 Tax=Nocardiopsis alba TaxID=53437 RepID=UPI0033AEC89C
MAKEFLTDARTIVIAITMFGTIAASHFRRKSEEAKEKQLAIQRRTFDGPENRIQKNLSRIKSIYKAAKEEASKAESNRTGNISQIEERAKQIEKIADAKHPSEDKAVDEIFKTTAAAEKERKEPPESTPESKEKTESRDREGRKKEPETRSRKSRGSRKRDARSPEMEA